MAWGPSATEGEEPIKYGEKERKERTHVLCHWHGGREERDDRVEVLKGIEEGH